MVIKVKQKDGSFKEYIIPDGIVLSNDLKEWIKHEENKSYLIEVPLSPDPIRW